MIRIAFLLITLSIAGSTVVSAQRQVAVLPFRTVSVDPSIAGATYGLLEGSLAAQEDVRVVPERMVRAAVGDLFPQEGCADVACALAVAEVVEAETVVYGTLSRLGRKIVFQYAVADAVEEALTVSDHVTALEVEELDVVMQRVARGAVRGQPASRVAEVGLVTRAEASPPRQRRITLTRGLAFGYLYPTSGYDDDARIFAFDVRSIYEGRTFGVTSTLGLRHGFLVGLGGLYLPLTGDFSPYLGAGLNFHFVHHDAYYDDWSYRGSDTDDLREDGPGLTLHAGLLAFRTYDFRLMVGAEYLVTFNDYDDRAVGFTVSLMRSGKRIFGLF